MINELFGIEYPIMQGGMAWVSDADLAAAVSNAGGLGIIAAGNAPGEWVREQINKIKTLTDKPFGVNVMLLSPLIDEVIKVTLEEKVPVIITGAGNPGKYIKDWKENGSKVVPVVPSTALARRMVRRGVDAIIAEGAEAGGHIGKLNTMVLVSVIKSVVDIPVIAAGGIFDTKTAAAAFALGADGIQVGTRFIVAKECNAHDNYKQRLIKSIDIDTKVAGRITGHPVRAIRNKLTKRLGKLDKNQCPENAEIFENEAAGSLRAAVVDGDMDNGSVMAGQCACMITCEESAKEIIESIFDMGIKDEIIRNIEKAFYRK